MSLHSYLVPDYYPGFKCKGGQCSRTCCAGWRITISMRKYFELLGINCSKELRGRLDRAFCLCDNPSPERYAQIAPTMSGNCPVQTEDGLCALQLELGERVLTEACRYYPRAMRSEYRYECSAANSCEAVVEQLLFRSEPISFRRKRLFFMREDDPTSLRLTDKARYVNAIRGAAIQILQDRNHPFCDRMIRLGAFISELSEAGDGGQAAIKKILASIKAQKHPPDDNYAVTILHYLISWFEEARPESAACEYFIKAQTRLGIEGADELDAAGAALAAEKYRRARDEFRADYPDYDTMSEQIMVNHLFYSGFPFSGQLGGPNDEYLSFSAVYSFVRLLTVACHNAGDPPEKITDIIATAFRLIEHSGFDRNTAILMKRAGCNTPERIAALLLI